MLKNHFCPILVRFAHAIYSLCEICISKVKAICSLRERDIVSCRETAIYSPVANVVESTLHVNPHAAQFAAYRAAGISLATRQISQIREDLYRFSLSASSDKLNFPRVLCGETSQTDTRVTSRSRGRKVF